MLKKLYGLIFLGILFLGGVVFAGTFTPDPASPDSSFYTLSDIYNKINAGTEATTHDFAPTLAPAGTFKTLTEIWDAIPPHITLLENDLDTGIFPAGIYGTTTDLTVIDPDLIPANVATGTVLFGVTGTCVPPPLEIPTNGLISYWPFDGNADDSVGSNNGVITDVTLVPGIKNEADTAYDFDSFTGDYITFANPNITTAYSSSVWIKPRSYPTAGQWTIYRDKLLANLSLTGGGSGSLTCNYNSGDSWVNSTVQCIKSEIVPLDQWTHIVCTQGTDLTLYVNGVSCNTANNVSEHVRNGGTLTVGAWLGTRDYPAEYKGFDGVMDELRFYDRALTPREVTNIYNIEKP